MSYCRLEADHDVLGQDDCQSLSEFCTNASFTCRKHISCMMYEVNKHLSLDAI